MALLSTLPESRVLLAIVGTLLCAYTIYGIFYRLFLSPIAKFPGPKLAAVTYGYEFFYDGILGGEYTNRIKAMHSQYGPIIRINPHELHVSDSRFYSTLYSPSPNPKVPNGTKRHKWSYQVQAFGTMNSSTFATLDHDQHHRRRRVIEPFFSPAQVRKLQDYIAGKVDRLCERMYEWKGTGKFLRIKLAFTAMTTDILTGYTTGEPYGYLEHETFFPEWHDTMERLGLAVFWLRHLWWVVPILENLPKWVSDRMDAGMRASLESKEKAMAQVTRLKKNFDLHGPQSSKERPTVFHEVLLSDLPESDKTPLRMRNEAQDITAAGSETVAATLTVLLVHVLDDAEVLDKLRRELVEAVPNPDDMPPLQVLEKLPYLNAVIREGLRLSYGVMTRIPRIADVDMRFNDWIVPAGTPVSMTAQLVHDDTKIYKDPRRFDPERWMDPEEGNDLFKYMVAFSKGPLSCLGTPLAMAELYLTIPRLLRRFDLTLCDTSASDLDVLRDHYLPGFRKNLKEIKLYVN